MTTQLAGMAGGTPQGRLASDRQRQKVVDYGRAAIQRAYGIDIDTKDGRMDEGVMTAEDVLRLCVVVDSPRSWCWLAVPVIGVLALNL